MKNKKIKKNKLDDFAVTKRKYEIEETAFWLSILSLFVFGVIGGVFLRCSNIPVAIVFFLLTAIAIIVMIACLFSDDDCVKKK